MYIIYFNIYKLKNQWLCKRISCVHLNCLSFALYLLACRYHERMLECCVPLDDVRERGVTLEQFARIAACNTLQVRLVRAPYANARAPGPLPAPADSASALGTGTGTGAGASAAAAAADESREEHEFRRVLKRCTAVDDRVLVCAYSRRVVGQTGVRVSVWSGLRTPSATTCTTRPHYRYVTHVSVQLKRWIQ